jgi:signal transduction histidine kinase
VDLNVLIQKVLENLHDPIVQTGAAIEVGKMPALEAEELQMHLLFENLLRNSLTFVRERPVIKITSEEVKETTPSGEKRLHRITVEDNGIGFEQEIAEKAFKPFGRLHDQERYPGIGMGLALCRKIVELHGGTISVKSKRGKGSTFTIRFPAEPVDL